MAAPLTSTLNLILQTVVLVILVAAIAVEKRNPRLGMTLHHNVMVVAVLLNIVGLILVMIPSEAYFISVLGTLSSATLTLSIGHGIFGALGLIFGIAFVFKLLPGNIKLWMWVNTFFWSAALVFGFLQYLNISVGL